MIKLISPTYLVLLVAVVAARQQHQSEGSQVALAESNSGAMQSVLLDTTELSSLGWTKYPDGGLQTRTPGWVEESFTNFERGINWRSVVVCDVAFNSVNNWLWTPFIERGEANRLYIEIKFTMRDCNLFPQMVLSCKETFALLYKEMDSPIQSTPIINQQLSNANASFAQSDSYTLIDTIAADEGRFTSSTDVVINTEVRSIPVSKRGVYFAFRDQGACLSLISIKVYHLRCPALSVNFAQFNATPTGRDLTSLVAVEGTCTANSVQVEQPKMFCSADGNWNSMSSGQCKCLAGFEAAQNNTKCLPCPPNTFKANLGSDSSCQICPDRSYASSPASSECRCQEGFFRAAKDARSASCTQPPSAPTNLSAIYVDSTSVVLRWQEPRYTGFREDLTYRLVCDQCDQAITSPSFLANFSETKCVIAGLQPATSYRFLIYAMNGVSALSQTPVQFSEISLQTGKPVQQTASNTLSGQGGFQLTPIYNMRALQGARGSDMVLSWDAQPISSASGQSNPDQLNLANQLGGFEQPTASSPNDLLPSLYEIRYQPRQHLASGELAVARRSPYPTGLIAADQSQQQQQATSSQPQTITTTSRALLIGTLAPATEYAFQIRAKWAHSSQWSEFSEPVYMWTSSQVGAASLLASNSQAASDFGADQILLNGFQQVSGGAQIAGQPATSSSSTGWLSTFALFLLCALVALSLLSLTLVHYRKSACLQSLAGGFGHLAGSSYGGVYGGSTGGLGGFGGGGATTGPLSAHHLRLGAGLHQHHTMLGSSSAGGLITGSNATSRSSSTGHTGNVVQNFIAATLSQISGHAQSNLSSGHNQHSKVAGGVGVAHTMGDGKLFAPANGNGHLGAQLQRNHYHQTTLNQHHHTLLLHNSSASNNSAAHFQQFPAANGQQQAHLANGPQTALDPFKCRTLNQQAGAQFIQQQDPQLHIYDDLDTTNCSSMALPRQQTNELDPQQVIIKSVIGRGEFGDVCLALLRNGPTERHVAVKTLKAQANDKAKLDFLIEASIMCQFEHPNIIHLEGVVTKSEPPMIVTEFMENGALDRHLQENKNRFSCLQLISMLRGIANGMQYLAKLGYVHKDLAARNILVNGQNVCKIADFGLSAHSQQTNTGQLPGGPEAAKSSPLTGDYINDSSSTNSSNSLSSRTTGSTPTTASTMAGGCGGNLSQLQSVAEQLAQQRFVQQQTTCPAQQQQLPSQNLLAGLHCIQNPKIPVRWTALEAIAFRRFTSASDVWSFGVVCWEVMTEGERPYWNWSNQDVIKAVEQGYRLPQPENCPEQLYKLMLDCWLKERAARPSFGQILKTLDRLLSPYDDPFCPLAQLPGQPPMVPQQPPPPVQPQLVPMHTRISANQEPAYYDTYNHIGHLLSNKALPMVDHQHQQQQQQQQSVDDWLDSIKMSRYKENLQRNQINSLQYVARLSQADLNLIGIQNNSHVKKILGAIASLRSSSSIGASGEGYLV